MRSGLLSFLLVAALWVAIPASAAAQEPEPAPAPAPAPPSDAPAPAAREYAVPRAAAPRGESIVVREPQSDANTVPRRDTSSADQGQRRRPPAAAAAPAPPPASTNTRSDDQGAERRGAVRRPPDRSSDRGRATVERAVPRASVPPRTRDRDRIIFYPDYWSWGRYYNPSYYGGLHVGYLAYSPWGWTPAFYGYPYSYGAGYGYGYGRGYDMGSLKIKVSPRDAEVYVDGYFAGHVDDFDGIFQSLKLETGGYRIEVRKPGYETLHFDVHVQPDRTITYRGVLRPTP